MAVSDWSTKEAENTHLDELTLSGEGGLYINKLMCAVKEKFDGTEEDIEDLDGSIEEVASDLSDLTGVVGGLTSALTFKGTVATADDLPSESVSVGDTWCVTASDNKLFSWNGEEWADLGAPDSGVVHVTGDEIIAGVKTFSGTVYGNIFVGRATETELSIRSLSSGSNGASITLYNKNNETRPGVFRCVPRTPNGNKVLEAYPDGTFTWGGNAIQVASDERLKTPLSAVPDEVLDAWEKVEWGRFKFLDAVERKGEAARHHLGVIAQRIKAVFEADGLDACRYGILCYVEDVESASEMWTVRYEEALAMEACCQRRRADRLEARLAALEAHLGID